MPDPQKLTILKAVVDGLKTITPANGYVSDLSDFDPGDGVDTSRVYRGRAFFGAGDPVPMLSVLEAAFDDEVVNEPADEVPTSEYWWPLLIQGWIIDDKDNPTDPVYPLLADVRKYLSTQLKRHGSDGWKSFFGMPSDLVVGLRFSGGRVRPASELSAYAGFHLIVELRIIDKADKPYG